MSQEEICVMCGYAKAVCAFGSSHKGACWTTQKAKELSLLVIDLGDCCVVKVEKGNVDFASASFGQWHLAEGEPAAITHRTFDELKTVLHGEKPVPRIEVEPNNDSYYNRYHVYTEAEWPYPLNSLAYNALSTLIGHPLPVYEGGKWKSLCGITQTFQVWRYTR